MSKKKNGAKFPSETAGANITEEVVSLGNKGGISAVVEVGLDMEKVGILELLRKAGEIGVELKFKSGAVPDLGDDNVLNEKIFELMNYKSKQNYFLEKGAQDAEERKRKQVEDEDYIGDAIQILDEPEMSGRFKSKEEDYVNAERKRTEIVHVRPDEVERFKKMGYESLGTIEGTPVGMPGSKLESQNMVRMEIPKKTKKAYEKHYGDRSKKRLTDDPSVSLRKESIEYLGGQ